MSDEIDEKAGTAPSGPLRPGSVTLADIVSSPELFNVVKPNYLFDALIEGELDAFIRLPSSFDCSISVPRAYWRTVDPGDFAAAFGSHPYSADRGFRLPTTVTMNWLLSCIENNLIQRFTDDPTETPTLLYFFPDASSAYGAATPIIDKASLLQTLRRELTENIAVFLHVKGYACFVLTDDALSLFSSDDHESEPLARRKRGAKPLAGWDYLWPEIVRTIEDDHSLQRKAYVGRALDAAKRCGVQELPDADTVLKRLSQKIPNSRK